MSRDQSPKRKKNLEDRQIKKKVASVADVENAILVYECPADASIIAEINSLLSKMQARHSHTVELYKSMKHLFVPNCLEHKTYVVKVTWSKIKKGGVFYFFKNDFLKNDLLDFETVCSKISAFKPSICLRKMEKFANTVNETNMYLLETYDLLREMHGFLRTPLGIVPSHYLIPLLSSPVQRMEFESLSFPDRIRLFTAYMHAIQAKPYTEFLARRFPLSKPKPETVKAISDGDDDFYIYYNNTLYEYRYHKDHIWNTGNSWIVCHETQQVKEFGKKATELNSESEDLSSVMYKKINKSSSCINYSRERFPWSRIRYPIC